LAKKIIPFIAIIVITALTTFFFIDTSSFDREAAKNIFEIKTVYFENEQFVEISFNDKTQKTTSVILEVLGMEKSFQKTFTSSNFVERIEFLETPKYGWQVHPVTFLVEHESLGVVSIKTEIHNEGEPEREIIFGNP